MTNFYIRSLYPMLKSEPEELKKKNINPPKIMSRNKIY